MKKQLLLLFSALSFGATILNAQSAYNGGLVPLSPTAYANLPVANWDTLKKYAPVPPPSGTAADPVSTILNTPPIGNQNPSGTCVGWAVGYTAMSMLMYPKYKNCWKYALRSPNYIYNQLPGHSTDCSAGTSISDALNLVKAQGVCSWDLMPFNQTNCSIQPNSTQTAEAANNKALDWGTVSTTDVAKMKKMIDMGYPIIIGIYTNMNWYTSITTSPGILSNYVPNPDGSGGAHAVCIIGYDNTKNAFKIQDQSGVGGRYDNGFWWITYDLVQSGQEIYEAYVMYRKSTIPPDPVIGVAPYSTKIVSSTPTASKKSVQISFPASTADRIFHWSVETYPITDSYQEGTGGYNWSRILVNGDTVIIYQHAVSTCGSYVGESTHEYYKLKNGALVPITIPVIYESASPSLNIKETTLYPNPTTDILNIQISGDYNAVESNIIMYDLSGKQVKALKTNLSFETLSVADLPNGIYYVKIFNSAGSSMKKLVIRR